MEGEAKHTLSPAAAERRGEAAGKVHSNPISSRGSTIVMQGDVSCPSFLPREESTSRKGGTASLTPSVTTKKGKKKNTNPKGKWMADPLGSNPYPNERVAQQSLWRFGG